MCVASVTLKSLSVIWCVSACVGGVLFVRRLCAADCNSFWLHPGLVNMCRSRRSQARWFVCLVQQRVLVPDAPSIIHGGSATAGAPPAVTRCVCARRGWWEVMVIVVAACRHPLPLLLLCGCLFVCRLCVCTSGSVGCAGARHPSGRQVSCCACVCAARLERVLCLCVYT